MRSKNILYAMMFASLSLATTGCDKELPLSAPSEGDELGYRVALLSRAGTGESINKDDEDRVNSLQVVCEVPVTTKNYYDATGWDANKGTNHITFNFFKGTHDAYYIANLPNRPYSTDKNSNYFVESNGMALPTLGYCRTPIVMVAKKPNLSYNWNTRSVSSDGIVVDKIRLTRVLAGLDVTVKIDDAFVELLNKNNNDKSKVEKVEKITVDKVELMSVPDKIGLKEDGKLGYQIKEEEDPYGQIVPPGTDPNKWPKPQPQSYYADKKHFLGQKVEDFKKDYGSDIYVRNFVEPLGDALIVQKKEKRDQEGHVVNDMNGKPIIVKTYSIEYGSGPELYTKTNGGTAGYEIPRRYVPANPEGSAFPTKVRLTLTKTGKDKFGKPYTETRSQDFGISNEILANNIYTKSFTLTEWTDGINFKVETGVRPWTYVKYTEDFDLDY